MGQHWKHLTETDRYRIHKWLKEGMKAPEIAKLLRVHKSTVYRELERGQCIQQTTNYEFVSVYCPDVAERRYRENLAAKGPMEKIGKDKPLADFIGDLIRKQDFSPAAAAVAVRNDTTHDFSFCPCEKTIYNYIPKGIFWGVTQADLPRKGKHKRKYNSVKKTVGRAPAGHSIEDRPDYINNREEPFHWEMDCVLSRRKTKAALLVLTERLTRFELIIRIVRHTADNVVAALDQMERKLGTEKFREVFKSITVDNGSEFANCAGMERSIVDGESRTICYYCHPYTSCERGSNENQNGLIRRHFPKGTNFDEITDERVQCVQDWLNNYPREILGWETAGNLFKSLLEN